MLIFDVEATHYLPVPSWPVLRLYQTCIRSAIKYIFRLFIHNSLSESIFDLQVSVRAQRGEVF